MRRGDKSDFNDLLREAGPEAVKERIEIALNGPKFVQDKSVSLNEGEALLENAVGRFFTEILDHFFIPYYAIQTTVGLGKTEEVLRQSVLLVVSRI